MPASAPTPHVAILGGGFSGVLTAVNLVRLGADPTRLTLVNAGWLPQAHFRGIDYDAFPPPGTDLAALGLDRLVTLMEEHCARLRDLGANPAIIVDKLRPHPQRLWQAFSADEKRRFVRDHAARWNILRHRIAPEIHAQLASAQLTGQLQVHAALIQQVAAAGNRVRVELAGGRSLEGDLVLNATGPQTRFSATRSPLLQNLLRRSLITPDELDLGLRIDADHVAIDAEGRRSPHLLALGPLLLGTYWETIAVPELRGQALRVAQTLLGQAPATSPAPVMMEYMI